MSVLLGVGLYLSPCVAGEDLEEGDEGDVKLTKVSGVALTQKVDADNADCSLENKVRISLYHLSQRILVNAADCGTSRAR